mgnify:CR=1 FL=1
MQDLPRPVGRHGPDDELGAACARARRLHRASAAPAQPPQAQQHTHDGQECLRFDRLGKVDVGTVLEAYPDAFRVRLDRKANALKGGDSGEPAVMPGCLRTSARALNCRTMG